ncbi:MAG: thioredoxin domain-containing protein [Acidimicrobiia bacterium]|jgi:hypothetical protein
MPNRLADATSPYLRQHAENPVDWYEWGEEALSEAARRDCPVLLSVGYAACHWCHVMAHESFEDRAVAALMNERFVNIKVDREERPDIDRIYMDAVQAMTGHGGWPMTVFLLPGGEPFLAGTYFPAEPRGGLPSFRQVLERVAEAWDTHRDDLHAQGRRVADAIAAGLPPGTAPPAGAAIRAAVTQLAGLHDPVHGGFGGAPKFPQAPFLELLVRVAALHRPAEQAATAASLLRSTLDGMAAGGIYDHVGGGFARYAVDAAWHVPHFEKMLSDNAQLARIYLRASQVIADRAAAYRGVATETLDYLMRDMTQPGGGLASSEDADSDGGEGRYSVWTWDELDAVLGEDRPVAAALFGATPAGTFEGANVLHRAASPEKVAATFGIPVADVLATSSRALAALRAARAQRVRPAVDDKIVTAWNGLAIRAFAEAGVVLGSDRYLAHATGIASFAVSALRDPGGRLLRSRRAGAAGPPGFCDDYAALAIGLFALYQAGGDERWFDEAERLTRDMIGLFAAEDPGGGFFATGSDAAPLIVRPKNVIDGATPADNTLAAEAIQLLAAFTGDADLGRHLDGIVTAAAALVERQPTAVAGLLAVLAAGDDLKEVAVVGAPAARAPLTAVVWERFRPDCVLAAHDPGDPSQIPLLEGRTLRDSTAAAYVCRHFTCRLPVTTPDDLRAELDG